MKNWFLKTFKKSECVRMIVFTTDRRYTVNYEIPDKDNTVPFKNGKYGITSDNAYYEKGIPTYIYFEGRPEPIEPSAVEMPVKFTAEYFDTAMNNNIVRELFDSTKSVSTEKMQLLQVVINVVSVAVVWFLLDGTLQSILHTVERILEIIDPT